MCEEDFRALKRGIEHLPPPCSEGQHMNDNKLDSIADALAIAFVAALTLFFAASVIKMYW